MIISGNRVTKLIFVVVATADDVSTATNKGIATFSSSYFLETKHC